MNQEVLLPEFPQGELAPPFELYDGRGVRVTRSQFRDRRLLLLGFAAQGVLEPLLCRLDEARAHLEWLEAEVLLVLPAAPDDLPESNFGFRYLADPDLSATRKYTAVTANFPLPTLVLLDRYGALEQRWIAPDLPEVEELLDHIEIIAMRC
jgi:hypothetical protein